MKSSPSPFPATPPALPDASLAHLNPYALRPWPGNARTHSKKQVRQIAESITIFGFTNPVLIDETNMILAGHGRVAAAKLLGLETYFTAGEQEVRAWTIHRGDTAPKAAGVIHTDFERGFIKADTVGYDDFVAMGGWKGAREKGAVRSEGKEYVVQDGDVMLFKFNV